jgi:hypothetical protein
MYRVEWDRLRVCNVDWSRFSNARLTLRWAYIGQEARVRGTGYAGVKGAVIVPPMGLHMTAFSSSMDLVA